MKKTGAERPGSVPRVDKISEGERKWIKGQKKGEIKRSREKYSVVYSSNIKFINKCK